MHVTRSGRRTRRLRIAALAAAVPLLATASVSASASTTAGRAPHQPAATRANDPGDATPLPTVVLEHGAFADASGWSAEIAQLTAAGFPVVAPANPLRGLSSDAAYLRSVLDTIQGPIILVGHSYGGAVITDAATGDGQVKALVYVGAFVPDAGESLATIFPPQQYPGSLLGPQTLLVRPYPGSQPDGQPNLDLYINPSDFRSVFAGDISPQRAAVMAAEQRPLSYTAFTEPSTEPAWKTIPSWDLITLNDRAIPPAGQLFAAQRAGAHIRTVYSAHDVMVSHPDAVVSIIEQAYHATR